MKHIVFLFLFFNICFCISAQEIRINYFHNFGAIEGFSQIPKGGQYGTTSIREPTFDQLGINKINYSKLFLELSDEKWGIYFEIKNNQFRGKNVLKKEIKTHDVKLPLNTKIESKHKYNFYNIGLKHVIYENNNFKISPKIEFSVFDFKYTFSAENKDEKVYISNDTRNFKAGGVRIGGNFEYFITNRITITTDMMTHIPYGSIKKSLEVIIVLSQNIYKKKNKEINLLYGIGYDFFKYKDSQQDMQNYMKNRIAPIFIGGLEYKF